MRGVRAARRVVQEHRAVRGDRLDVVEVLDGPVGDVDAEVVPLLRGGRSLNRVVVVHQVRVPLVGLPAEEAVEAFEATADRPVPFGGRRVHLVLGAQVPLSDHRGGIAVLDQNLGEGGTFGWDVPFAPGKPLAASLMQPIPLVV